MKAARIQGAEKVLESSGAALALLDVGGEEENIWREMDELVHI